ncbi:ribonuclease H-like domain-containing protein [Candidatus Woesearchaeota archaeon]|nr:ribonuclease H-like domain-containing protein [Candidatus Woesearchaeota archaeon]
MVRHSFIFLPKIGIKKNNKIKRQVKDWNGFLNAEKIKGIEKENKKKYDSLIEKAKEHLQKEESRAFANWPKREMFRIYDYFKEEAKYLDIEVDQAGKPIMVGIYDGEKTKTWVKGINWDMSKIAKELSKAKVLVTFNGSAFDLPKLRSEGVVFDGPHYDLKGACQRIRLKGGLKEIEKKLNLKRPEHLYGNPVELWKAMHASNDGEYFELLLKYNEEDVINLENIAAYCTKKMKQEDHEN